MSSKQPERSQQFLPGMETNHVDASMHRPSEEERPANDARKSDSRIVPQTSTYQVDETKLGNASEGKATKLSRELRRPLSRLGAGDSVISRLNRISDRAKSNAGEVFNNLFSAHTVDLLRQAFHKLERGKAAGVDTSRWNNTRQTWRIISSDSSPSCIAGVFVRIPAAALTFPKAKARRDHWG